MNALSLGFSSISDMRKDTTISPTKWNSRLPIQIGVKDFGIAVDLGCGRLPRNPFRAKNLIGLDVFQDTPFPTSDTLSYLPMGSKGEIPLKDSSVDVLTAFDVLEHIPRQSDTSHHNPFIEAMNEIFRVLKPGGLFLAVTPCFPSHAAFQDPTHVNIITPATHLYFSEDAWARSLGYGFKGKFESVSTGWYDWNRSFLDVSTGINKESEGQAKSNLLKWLLSRLVSFCRLTTFRWLRRPSHFLWVLRKPTD